MLAKYTRPHAEGGWGGNMTESKVVELPDMDPITNEPTQLPDGAKLADPGETPHDWQLDKK